MWSPDGAYTANQGPWVKDFRERFPQQPEEGFLRGVEAAVEVAQELRGDPQGEELGAVEGPL